MTGNRKVRIDGESSLEFAAVEVISQVAPQKINNPFGYR
jgi:hypothetical protein